MSTAAYIVERALFKLRAHSPINPAPPETLDSCHDELISMLEAWERQEIDTGVLIPEPGKTETELAEPPDVTDAVVANLALKVAPLVGKEPDQRLFVEAQTTKHEIEKDYRYIDPPTMVPTEQHGEGNRVRSALNIRSYADR